MASLKKFKMTQVNAILRHDSRANEHYKNPDIDQTRTVENYSLLEDRDDAKKCYAYFKERMTQLEYMDRGDINVMATWIITQPLDSPPEEGRQFFEACHEFLAKRYGEKNVVSSFVHLDEGGQPHLHFSFIPTVETEGFTERQFIVVEYRRTHPEASIKDCIRDTGVSRRTVYRYWKSDPSYYVEKICASERLNKKELVFFHSQLQEFLRTKGVSGTVFSGITRQNGGNRTVKELKQIDSRLLEENRKLRKNIELLESRKQDLSRWQAREEELALAGSRWG